MSDPVRLFESCSFLLPTIIFDSSESDVGMNFGISEEDILRYDAGRMAAEDDILADMKSAFRRARAPSKDSHCYSIAFSKVGKDIPSNLCNLALKTFCKNVQWATREMQATLMGPGHCDLKIFNGDPVPLSREGSVKMFNLVHLLLGSLFCVNNILLRHSLSRRTVRILVGAWPHITHSMGIILDGRLLSKFISEHFLDETYPLICFTLMHIASRQGSQDLLLGDDVLEILSHLLLIDHNASSMAKPLKLEPKASATLTVCLETMRGDHRLAFMDKVLQRAHLDWNSFTLHLYHLLSRFWDDERRDYKDTATVLQSIVKVSLHEGFWTPNMKKLIPPLIPRILSGSSKAITRARSRRRRDEQIETVKQCIDFCSYAFLVPSGVAWPIQIFHHGILRAIVDCIPAVAQSPDVVQKSLVNLVCTVMPSGLIFGPIIDAASTAWKETIANKGEPNFEGDFFRREWYFLKNMIMERFMHKEIFTSKTGGKFSATCNRAGCIVREHEDRFVRCAGCRMAVYCSIECRKIDWKQLHRNVCKFSFVPENEHFRQRDYQCAVSILSLEGYRHRRGLKALALRKFPGVPLNQLTVVIDYSSKQRKLILDVENNSDDERNDQDDPPSDPREEASKNREQKNREFERHVSRIYTAPNKAVTAYRRPVNAFKVMRVQMRQGRLSMTAYHNGVKELLVPTDDDLRPTMPETMRGMRLQGVDREGNPLETTWDEFDESLYRINTFGGGDLSESFDVPLCSFEHLIFTHFSWVKGDKI